MRLPHDMFVLFVILALIQQASCRHRRTTVEQVQMHIVQGRFAQKDEFPFAATLLFHNEVLCTGSLISKRHVLTAAHCFSKIGEKYRRDIIVKIGALNGLQVTDGVAKRVSNYYISSFIEDRADRNVWSGDILVLELKDPITANVPFMCLRGNYKEHDGDTVTSIGFGNTVKDGKVVQDNILRAVDLKVQSEDSCDKEISQHNFTISADDYMCAGDASDGTLAGDSGGPLFMQAPSGEYCQVGICSFKTGDGYIKLNKPDGYTKVSKWCDWIEFKTRGEAKCRDF